MKITFQETEAAKKQLNKLRKDIRYDTRDYPIGYITDRFRRDGYEIPQYQRNKVWDQHKKERFIESILLGYPIPLIFLSEKGDGKLEIVDGVQRITTLSDFVSNKIILGNNLEKLNSLKGFNYSDLPDSEKRRFSDHSLRIIVLTNASLDTRIDLFNRLNTSSEPANDAEIRNGVLNTNEFQQLIVKLSESDLFIKIVHLSKHKTKRKGDNELVGRFFAYSNNYKNFKHRVDHFITNYIVRVGSDWNKENKSKYTKQFNDAFNFAKNYFPDGFLQNSRKQTPNARFEALMCGISLAIQIQPELSIERVYTENLLNDPEFKKLTTSGGNNTPQKVKNRIEYVRNYLLKYGK